MTPRCLVIAASTLPRWHRDAIPDFVLGQADHPGGLPARRCVNGRKPSRQREDDVAFFR